MIAQYTLKISDFSRSGALAHNVIHYYYLEKVFKQQDIRTQYPSSRNNRIERIR